MVVLINVFLSILKIGNLENLEIFDFIDKLLLLGVVILFGDVMFCMVEYLLFFILFLFLCVVW